ncbi:tyrosine-type recombinase/integrase [Mycobacteroides chelonae]|uniref:tyrosine-type recombinase/integrase n=1 Tax=Mycobacteroides chelonae TaxID=1774 RepID=UPI001F479621|nr:tyrosine-type recombinase/integrase [Mycobacteroides chelonae]
MLVESVLIDYHNTTDRYQISVWDVSYVWLVLRHFTAERALSPVDDSTQFVVVDQDFQFHPEATAYLKWLRSLDRSPNTERVYAGRVARFLSHCEVLRLDWRQVTVDDLSRYLRSLAADPIPKRSPSSDSEVRFRTNKTANANLTAVCEFLRFGASRGWVSKEIIDGLSRPKYLRRAPAGYDWGENQQFREIRSRGVVLREVHLAPATLSEEEVEKLLSVLLPQRDRFLILLLVETGMRIGEALGLRREDMHLLVTSAALGCRVKGPHVHVRRRRNSNGATAKSRVPRSIPVTQELVGAYASYLNERSDLAALVSSDFVFVNLKRPPVGSPMKYNNAKKILERASRSIGFAVRPHMLRHTAATRWLDGGASRDVVQSLLGHVSPHSMEVYLHPTDEQKRNAVDHVGRVTGGS